MTKPNSDVGTTPETATDFNLTQQISHTPPRHVLDAFDLSGQPIPLAGGQGTSWAVDSVVLKRVDAELQEWLGTVISQVPQDGFVLPTVCRAHTGDKPWVVDGWGAISVIPGTPLTPNNTSTAGILAVIQAGRALHAAVAHVPAPSFLTRRDDPWARADAAAWGERDVDIIPPLQPVVSALTNALQPLGPLQLIHGDLTGNVLLSPDSPPGVIDISPYFRPTAYAEGVVLADALTWHGAPPDILALAGVSVAAVARGLLFRVLTSSEMLRERPDPTRLADELGRYTGAAAALGVEVAPLA